VIEKKITDRNQWDFKPFEEVFFDSTKYGKKIAKELYLSEGKYPIIDQGQNTIAGYSDNRDNIYEDVPAIVFGDHTRVIKYVDKPFFLGADGVKLLKLQVDNMEYKYMYYYLLSAHIPNTGYNRHYKWLKDLMVPLPPLEIQQKIAAILDKANQLIELRKQQLAKMDLLIKSKFIAMFGDPVLNPMGWEKLCIGNRCDIVTGNTPPRADVDNYGEFIEWIKSDNINTPYVKLTMAEEYLSESGLKKARYVDAGSILMTCIAGSINCIGNIAIADRTVSFNQQINAIVPKGDRTEFLYWLLVISKAYIQSMVNKSMKGILSKSKLSEQRYIFPPIDLQNQFAAFVDKVEQQKAVMQASLEKLEINYKSLMQQYFG